VAQAGDGLVKAEVGSEMHFDREFAVLDERVLEYNRSAREPLASR